MAFMHQLHIQFYKKPLPDKTIERFFQEAGWPHESETLKAAKNHLPHPELSPLWVTLRHDQEVIGMATLYIPNENKRTLAPALLANFVITSSKRRQQIGTYFFHKIEQFCQTLGARTLILTTEPDSLHFWKSMGFLSSVTTPQIYSKAITPPSGNSKSSWDIS
jgi:N-acetylglutamate synthase-like GNAT family acetyltransferase